MEQSRPAPKNALSWFAIPTSDFERAARFYETILEYRLHVMGYGSERLAVFHHQEDGIAGALIEGVPSPIGTLVCLNVDERIDRTVDLITSAGGSIETAKVALPNDMGYAHFIDSEGNRVGLFEAKKQH